MTAKNLPAAPANVIKKKTKYFFIFQFDNLAQNTPLKLFQRNLSYDSSNPMSPITPTSINSRSFRGSPKLR